MTPSRESFRAPAWQAFVLALVAGYVDCFALVKYKVFASFMSGNTTTGGMEAGMAHLAEAAYDLLPIPLFVAGVFAGTSMMHSSLRRPVAQLLALVAVLLTGAIPESFLWQTLGWSSVMILSLAMGIMSAAIGHIGAQPVALGYVTGDLNSLGWHVALAARGEPLPDARDSTDTHGRRAMLLAAVWGTFLAGALAGGAATPRLAGWTLVLPVVVLSVLAAMARAQRERAPVQEAARR